MGQNISSLRNIESKGEKYSPGNQQPISLPMELIIEVLNRLSKGEKYSPGNQQPISLPMELIVEILNCVPVKDLLRFK
ncbi:hypothetical protein Tsubulata_003910, partial [Turnera subulata]